MNTTIELTTEQKISLQKEMGVIADELTLALASDVNENSFSDEDDIFIALAKTRPVSHPR